MTEITIRSSKAPPLAGYLRPAGLVSSLRSNGDLIRQFASREVVERHRGAYLGVAWNLVNPLITLTIYTFIFGYVFKSRWAEAGAVAGAANTAAEQTGAATSTAFVLPFFVGHALFHFFSESLNRAPLVVASRPNFVRKVVFPLEILPVVSVLSATVYPLVCLPCLLIAQFVLTGGLHATAVLLPLVVLPLLFLSMAMSWLLAAIGVFIRDVRHIVLVLTQLVMFMTPVFYSVDRIPPQWRDLYMLNPLAIVIENARSVVLWGKMPNWMELGFLTLISLVMLQVAYALFMHLRRGFADAV
jgi:lipopolysaccharide transport system permease protein